MALNKSREISIQWKLNPDAFQIINKTAIVDITRRFGSTINAVNNILIKKELLEMTMPIIIGMNSTDKDWQKTITNYWNSLAVDIPENGKTLEIGFTFDSTDKDRQTYIKDLYSKFKFKNDEEFANYVMTKVPEEDKYRYGTPLNVSDYLLWIYSFHYRDVANTPEDIQKASPFIRFYIHDDLLVKKQKEELTDLAINAQEEYIGLIKSNDAKDKIYNILCVLEPSLILEIEKLNDKEKQIRLFDLASRESSKFIALTRDNNLHTKALIEKLITKHILRKMSNTDVIVDIEDPSIVLGNTTTEAVTWFVLEQNKAKVSEYITRLSALDKIKV